MGTEPRFVVVGTGRSGTKYTAEALTRCGIRTGHEAWWNWTGEARPNFTGDSTWFAAPYLWLYDGLVYEQIRNPLEVVNSLIKSPEIGGADEARRRALCLRGDAVEQAIQITLGWRKMTRHIPAGDRWKLEEFGEQQVQKIADALEIKLDPNRVSRALGRVPHNVNWHGEAKFTYDWRDLPMTPSTRELMRLAEKDGYL